MKMPRVTVILTVYNAADHLQTAIDSVAAQTYSDFRCMIIDDGSTDRRIDPLTIKAVSDHPDHFVAVRLNPDEDERRREVRYARNINWGVRFSEMSEFVTFLCGDDFYLPDRLERMVAKLDEGHSVVYGAQELYHETRGRFGTRDAIGVTSDAFERVDLNSVMLTRTAFKKVGGFPTHTAVWRDADGLHVTVISPAGPPWEVIEHLAALGEALCSSMGNG